MKKFLAIAMAMLMALSLCSIALATDTTDIDGCEVDLTVGSITYDAHLCPGESYSLADLEGIDAAARGDVSDAVTSADDAYTSLTTATAPVDYDSALTSYTTTLTPDKAWKVSADWDIGGAMVSSFKWDSDDDVFYLNLNENYTISTGKRLKGTVTFTSKKDSDVTIDVDIDTIVTNHLLTVSGYSKKSDAEDDVIDAQDNTLYQCDEDNPGYICFNDGRLLSCTLKMVKNEKAFMYNDEDMVDAIDEKFGDTDATIDCYTFGGSPKFTNDAQFKLQADYADQYKVYTWANGKLTAQNYKWDSINGVYTWSTKAPATYVISDKELVAGSQTKDASSAADTTKKTKNPDTGANDVVGVAAALAVVSLVAAGAVSLKK